MKQHRKRPGPHTKLHSQRGAAAVEFAIVCPLLFLVVFGIIEFSILLYDKAVITNASREGARAGIVYEIDRSSGSIEARVNEAVNSYADNLINFGADAGITRTVSIEGDDVEIASGQALTVSLQYTYNFLLFPDLTALFGSSFSPNISLRAETVMRLE